MNTYEVLYNQDESGGAGAMQQYEAADYREEGSLISFYKLGKPVASVRTTAILSIRLVSENADEPEAAAH